MKKPLSRRATRPFLLKAPATAAAIIEAVKADDRAEADRIFRSCPNETVMCAVMIHIARAAAGLPPLVQEPDP